MTRAKFMCNQIAMNLYGIEYRFNAVTADDIPENESFFKYTPAGSLSITVTNPNVKFELGESYYLDFTPSKVEESVSG